jgi:hypothetical protein
MNVQLHEVFGTLGAALIVVTYLLIQLRRMQVADFSYSVLNALGAGLMLYSLSVDFNLSAFVIEAFWLLISCIGIVQALRERVRGGESHR